MPTIKPVSDLRNYTKVLNEVVSDAPVFLTKNGRGLYALMALQDYEKMQATNQLLSELARGRQSGAKGWLSLNEVQKSLNLPE
ncbi:MAG: type II toxin-antitoxin system prevent-host-death family antitoxin [Candidatus Margulisbacteria bacterium]|jgi:prevent-host-death family protein|nr:type II toxin-antitoxin system prevent-host-death family antitoxin [Candidatus Margulisiibacteriota bacterium]